MHRPEHPKPQFHRDKWLNLNGTWRFDFDFGLSGEEKGWATDPSALTRSINVPFCPESTLSGIGYTDFIPAVWYQREFEVPTAWAGQKVFLHFGAVDYYCRAWVNAELVGKHYGSSSSFAFDITDALQPGSNSLVVCAIDDLRSGVQPAGKQSSQLYSKHCHYTRTTGIWQTVWLEARPASHIDSVRIVPDLDSGRFVFTPVFSGLRSGLSFRVTIQDGGDEVAAITHTAASGTPLCVKLPEPHTWSPSDPHLYDLTFELLDGNATIDLVHSYAGLRKFHIEGNKFYLNNRPLFLRFVLDQGFYPDGIWTAPSDDELRLDIERSMAVGFNGARLHQKVFEERFHYWADKLGYLTSGEFCDMSMDFSTPQTVLNQQHEWREVVTRDLNHPSIVMWTPFNETSWGYRLSPEAHRRGVQETVEMTRQLDPTRPINDTSGYVHVDTDVYSVHDYLQNVEEFAARYADVGPNVRRSFCSQVSPDADIGYKGQPFFVDEYGGTWWEERPENAAAGTDGSASWGYGKRPESKEEVLHRIKGLTDVLTGHPNIAGYCYTQLTDIEQERNGVYTYDRRLKFDAESLKEAFGAPAAIDSAE